MREGYPEGPWEIRPVQASELPHHLPLNGIYAGGKLLATSGNFNHIGSAGLAALIAAAPDLLEALKQIVGNERRYEIPYDDYMQAVAALGRAEGRD